MKRFFSILFCLSGLAVLGQGTFVSWNRFVPSQVSSCNLAYRWVASDAANPVSTWTDRIQGAQFVQGDAASRPANSGTAISIDATHWMTNAVLPFNNTNLSVGFIFNVSAASFAGTQPMFWGGPDGSACNESYTGIGINKPGNNELKFRPGCVALTLLSDNFGGLTNQVLDLIVSQTLTNSATSGEYRCYTNGVLSVQDGGSGFENLVASSQGPTHLGMNPFRLSHTTFSLMEIWVWTNGNTFSVTNVLGAACVADFHNYTTNSYP